MANISELKEMGERIFLRRKILGLTQEQLAEKLGVSVQMISNLELGKKAIRPENLIKLSKVLQLSADYILAGENSDTNALPIIKKISSLNSQEIKIVESMVDYMISKK